MSVEKIGRALNLIDPRLTPAMRLLMVGIANHDGDAGAFPKVATLSRYVGVSERQIQKMCAQLEDIGRLKRELQEGGRRDMPDHFRPNRYLLNYDDFRGELEDAPCPGGHQGGELEDTGGGEPQATPEPVSKNRTGEPSNFFSDSGEFQLGDESKPRAKKAKADSAEAEALYQAYPLKEERAKALKAIAGALKVATFETIMAGIERYKKSPRVLAGFVKHPARWFGNHCWNDDLPAGPQTGRPEDRVDLLAQGACGW